MKKWMAMLLALALLAMCGAGLAEEVAVRAPEALYEELIVGSTTPMSGSFFTGMWGNNTADVDVRDLIHGYNLMRWRPEDATFAMDSSVVSGLSATLDGQGNKTYLISLYEDLLYSDASAITARDYVFSILLSAAPEVAQLGALTTSADFLTGSDEYRAGASQVLSGVRLISDYQFSVTIKAERLPFFYELALLNFNPYPISVLAPGCEVADDGQGAYIRNIDQTVAEPLFTAERLSETLMNEETGYRSRPTITSGPYVLASYGAEAAEATFAINPNYKGDVNGQKPAIERLTYRHVRPEEAMGKLASGEIDLLNKCVNAPMIDQGLEIAGEGMVQTANYPRVGMSLVSFNCEDGPVQFQPVRQAIALCFDRTAFLNEYVAGYGMQVNGYYGIGQWMVQLINGTIAPPVEQPAEGADEAALAAYDEAVAAWEALTLDELKPYALDTAAALELLIQDGWTLNEEGEPFDAEKDAVRCKQTEDGLMKLDLKLIAPEGNAAVSALQTTLVGNLATVGVRLAVEEKPMQQLLRMYYRQEARDSDMFYLATNFLSVFDPAPAYDIGDAFQGSQNTTGLRDERLMNLTLDMRATQAGDVLGYCQKWMAFQTYWNEALPAIPVYSNIYFDFYTTRLQNYLINNYANWPQAILYAYLSDPADPEPEDVPEDMEGARDVEGEIEIFE